MPCGVCGLELAGVDEQLFVVFAFGELVSHVLERLDGVFHVLHGVLGGRDEAEQELPFRDDGVNHDGTEEVVILAQVEHDLHAFCHAAGEVDGGHHGVGDADVHAVSLEPFLEGMGDGPQFFAAFGLRLEHFQAFDGSFDHGHGEGFGKHLGTHVVAEGHADIFVGGNESAEPCHGFGKSAEIEVYFVLHAEVFAGAGSRGSHGAEAVRVVHEEAEVEFGLHGSDFIELAEVACHAEHAFGHDEDAAAGGLHVFRGVLQLFAQAVHVVVYVHVTFGRGNAQAVHDAGVRFGVVDDAVVAGSQAVDDGNHALVAEVE